MQTPNRTLFNFTTGEFPTTVEHVLGDERKQQIYSQLFGAMAQEINNSEEFQSEIPPIIVDLEGVTILQAEFVILPTVLQGESSDQFIDRVFGSGISKEQREKYTLLLGCIGAWKHDGFILVGKKSERDAEGNLLISNYSAAVLKGEDGNVEAFVADTVEDDNAIYIWRKDASDKKEWIPVLASRKPVTREEAQAIRVNHTGSGELDRIMDKLTMPKEAFEDLWLKRTIKK